MAHRPHEGLRLRLALAGLVLALSVVVHHAIPFSRRGFPVQAHCSLAWTVSALANTARMSSRMRFLEASCSTRHFSSWSAKWPLIHSRATIGGGAFYMKGKRPGSINYLEESDFMSLTAALFDAVADCDASASGGA